MSNGQNRSTCMVERGLYVLRYVASAAGRDAPSASVRPASGSERVRLIAAPGRPEGELPFPGSALVIYAEAAGAVEIAIQPYRYGGSLDAQFTLDLVAPGGDVREAAAASSDRSPWDPRPAAVEVQHPVEVTFLAHVSRRGDVVVGPGEWAAGPSQPAPIEGVEFRPLSRDLGIEAQFTNTRDGRWSPWLRPGAFVGTRQQASPLTGLRLRLVGEGADGRSLQAEALFLGSPVVAQNDRMIELVSPAGVDPLVGLRLGIASSASQDDVTLVAKPRVRVFRAAKSAGE